MLESSKRHIHPLSLLTDLAVSPVRQVLGGEHITQEMLMVVAAIPLAGAGMVLSAMAQAVQSLYGCN